MAKKGPKKIAGVKVPKKVRKSLGSSGNLLKHPLVADLVAAALIAAAAAIRDSKTVRSAASKARDKAGDAAVGVGSGLASVGTIVAAKAKEGLDYMGEAYEGAGTSNGSGKSGSSGSSSKKGKSSKKSGKKKS